MKTKFIVLLFVFIGLIANSNANEFLKPSEAFQTNFINEKNNLRIEITLTKDIYLYANKIKLETITQPIIKLTKEIIFPQAEKYHDETVYFKKLTFTVPYSLLKEKGLSGEAELKLKFQGCSTAGLCYAPISKKTTVLLNDKNIENKIATTEIIDTNINETDTIANTLKNGNIGIILATFFGFGLLLSLTPCVFPMIPILSSIIVGASKKEKMTATKGVFLSLVYVLSMSVAYTLAGVLAGVFGANLQVALQNPYVLTVFAFVFVALAFSMFGYFEIKLPNSLQAKLNKTTDGKEKQGIAGIAIMGFLSALIVGPCVAPPLAGALVYIGQTGDAVLGGIALFVMSLGMGVPLLLIGLGAGKFMPKPGGWMESITKIFGIVMLGVAIWLLDRVLNPTLTMILWSLLFIGTAQYLQIYKNIITQTFTMAILILGAILLVGTISGATNPLNPFEKFISPKGVSNTHQLKFTKVKNIAQLEETIKNSSKPVILDFYADWCIACKEYENITFKDAEVMSKLQNFTLLKADVTKNSDDDKALQEKFNIVGPPGIIFWDTKNQEIKSLKIVGYKNPTSFLKVLNKVEDLQ